jgi:hypothetical protein
MGLQRLDVAQMTPLIFISYSHLDRKWLKLFHDALKPGEIAEKMYCVV